jgi:anti-sigma regulatory factor (Ser/Thr protein kinase)
VRFNLPERIVIPDARTGGAAALDRLEDRCRAAGLAEPIVLDLRVVAEEVVTNVAKYGFEPGAAPAMELLLSFTEDAALLEFRDHGRAFDPLGQPPPGLDAPLADRPVGGLGLTLVRGLVDEAAYAREGTMNVLRLVKRRVAQ